MEKIIHKVYVHFDYSYVKYLYIRERVKDNMQKWRLAHSRA